MFDRKTIEAPNGDQFTIKAITPGLLRKVLIDLKKEGIKISTKDDDLLTGIEYQQHLSNAILVDWKRKEGTELVDTTAFDRKQLVETRPKVVSWIMKRANELNAEDDAAFEEDSKN